MAPAAISRTITSVPEDPPPEESSPEETGTALVVSVFVPCSLLPFFFSLFVPPLVGRVVVAEEPLVVPVEEEEGDFWPLEGTFGRYSCPELVAEALAANTQSMAAATQRAGIVLRAIIGSVGSRRY